MAQNIVFDWTRVQMMPVHSLYQIIGMCENVE